jgi:UPF0271 protein
MTSKKTKKIYILDTSAVLSGKPIDLNNSTLATTPKISGELKPSGRDYQAFQYLKEKGLSFLYPTNESIKEIDRTAIDTGDIGRLSEADKELLAVALDIKKKAEKHPVILTDDYSIQNVANMLDIEYENISEPGIKKRFKWITRCRGCGKRFEESINKCPICGSKTKNIIIKKENLTK